MRTIKFRGKRIDNGEWVYGSLVSDTFDNPETFEHKIDFGIMEPMQFPVEIHKDTIGQSTEVKDRTGITIYEGDILRRTICIEPFGRRISQEVVVWGYAGFDCVKLSDNTDRTYLKQYAFNEIEVVGNIHDKPTTHETEN